MVRNYQIFNLCIDVHFYEDQWTKVAMLDFDFLTQKTLGSTKVVKFSFGFCFTAKSPLLDQSGQVDFIIYSQKTE